MKKSQNTSKKPWVIRLTIIAFCIIGIFILSRVYFRLTDDFRLSNMMYDLPHRQEWEVGTLENEEIFRLKEILKKPFFYIGKGAQSYAFASDDGRYVLKFFKFKHLKPHWLVELFPPFPPFSSYKNKQSVRKWNKLESVFSGYRLGYEVHRRESGLIFIHLNKTHLLFSPIKVKDKLGFDRTIPLDDVVFIVQEKALTTRTIIQTLLNNRDVEGAKQRIKQIFDLYLSEYHKGIYDRDHGVMHNTGFVEGRPIHLDIGKLTADESMKLPKNYIPDLTKIAMKFAVYIRTNYPEFYPEMQVYIEALMTEVAGSSFHFQEDHFITYSL